LTGRRERSAEVLPLGDVLGRLTEERPLATGMALGRLSARWEDVVGQRLAAETAPVGLDRGTLTVAVSSAPWAAQVRFLSEEIARKATAPSAPVSEVRTVIDAVRIRRRYGNTDGRMLST
jgi:predicted nucleic acid-binding Zn ribbon protein